MDLYQQNILDHYKNPRRQGKLTGAVKAGKADNLSCGDSVSFEIVLKADVIADIGWTGDGCVLSQAAASMLAETAVGLKVDVVKKYDTQTIINLLGITPGPNRLQCALLALDALKKAL